MLMASVGLYDQLSFRLAKAGQLSFSCTDKTLPTGSGNLVYRAAEILSPYNQSGFGIKIHLKKRIPAAAGLAGGSSDAAAALIGLNKMWALGLGQKQLQKLAAQLGSDVPYCLEGGWALAEGRGEKLRPQVQRRRYWILLANPGFPVSTPWAFKNFIKRPKTEKNFSLGALKALRSKNLEKISFWCMNDLESATARKYPEINALIAAMLQNGAITSRMSGSGATVWGLFSNQRLAEKALKNIKKKVPFAISVPVLQKNPPA